MLSCFLNLTLQPAVLSPQRSVASLLPYFSFFKLFSFTYLRTLPSSVSCKSFACHSYENGRGAYQQFPFRNSALSSRQPDPRLLRPRHQFLPLCAFCVLCDLCVKSLPFPFFRLSTLDSQPRLPPTYPISFQALADSFALCKIISPFFSCNSGLFAQNTRGWGRVHYNEGRRRYGAARRGRRKRKKASGLESRQT